MSTVTEQHDYIYASGKVLRETVTTTEDDTSTTKTLDFFYDANGTPYALKVNGTTYYYVTNLQGDVVQLVNSGGATVASYEYDPYGNIISQSGDIAEVNPLRYRSYYFDSESGFYYLQSRYYDPEIGRFINADSYASTGQGVLGFNMFAYCLNNPVNYVDGNGRNAEVLRAWTVGMGCLPFADTALPIGDVIYIGGILILGAVALASEQDYVPEISYDEADVAYGPPSPNDDDDDDDYYDDDSNFGGRQKVGKINGKTPRSNKVQNDQFNYAAKKAGINPIK